MFCMPFVVLRLPSLVMRHDEDGGHLVEHIIVSGRALIGLQVAGKTHQPQWPLTPP